jgi:hypothetical protein
MTWSEKSDRFPFRPLQPAGAPRGLRLIWKDRRSSGVLHVAELGPRIGTTEFLGAPARG